MIGDRDRATVRRAVAADAAAIARVYVETWRSTYAGMVPDPVLLRMTAERQEAVWSRILGAGGRDFVLVADDPAAGVVGFGNAGPLRAALPFGGEVYTLYVDQDFQDRGLGRRLLAELFAGLLEQGMDSAVVWVLASNPSRFFYEAMGGRRVAEQEEPMWGTRLPEYGYAWSDLARVTVRGGLTRGA